MIIEQIPVKTSKKNYEINIISLNKFNIYWALNDNFISREFIRLLNSHEQIPLKTYKNLNKTT